MLVSPIVLAEQEKTDPNIVTAVFNIAINLALVMWAIIVRVQLK
jgi:hypothetical protein